MPLLRVALMPHPGKEEALQLARELIARFDREGVKLWLEHQVAHKLDRLDLVGSNDQLATCRVAIVLGGDGALLKAARLAAPYGVPILGVNFGHLGFLTAIEPSGLEDALRRIGAGEFHTEERLMIEACHVQADGQRKSLIGLNDAVVARGPFARVVEFEVRIDGALAGRFHADGVIVSTPTGSTGYSLSAGGPIVNPGVEALVVTPICPHTMGARGFVIRPDESVHIRTLTPRGEAMLTVDGQVGLPIGEHDEVIVQKAPQSARLIHFGERNFYSLLHERLRQGIS